MGKVETPYVPRPSQPKYTKAGMFNKCPVIEQVYFDELGNAIVTFGDGTIEKINSEMQVKYRSTQNTPHEMEEKVEKLFIQPKELVEAIDFSELDVIDTSEYQTPKFIEGENYALQGVACDGFSVKNTKVYKLIKVVNDFYGTDINSVIVKQIAGEQGVVFTLSKLDCEYHGIEYENGLMLFPKSLNWVRVKDKIPFDKNNLATTPLSDIDNTIRFVLLKLSGFKDYSDGYVVTPSGHLITEKHFVETLRVKSVEPIVYGNGYVVKDKTNLDIQLVSPQGVLFNHGNFISSEDMVYVMIRLKKGYMESSLDGFFGVEPKYFEGICPNDFFEISWDELGAYTVEEYEKIKAERERKEAERIRLLEEERKRKIAEEEKRIRDKRKRAEDAVNRMKGYDFKLPTFPKIPVLTFNGTISSMDMIVNSIDEYVDSLGRSLVTLSEDLEAMSKLSGQNFSKKVDSPSREDYDSDFNRLLKEMHII